MKKQIIISICITFSLLLTIQAHAIQSEVYQVVVGNLSGSPSQYLNNVVEIEGVVDRHLDDRTSAGFFMLRDNFGDYVRVRVLEEKPDVNKTVRVRGVYTREVQPGVTASFIQRYYIDSRQISEMDDPPPPPPSDYTVNINSEPSGAEVAINGQVVGVTPIQQRLSNGLYDVSIGKNLFNEHSMNLRVQGADISRTVTLERSHLFYALIAGSGLVLFIIIGIAFIRSGKNDEVYTERKPYESDDADTKKSSSFSDEVQGDKQAEPEIDNPTIKIYRPSEKTLKVLDDCFEPIEGISDVNKIFLYQNKDNLNTEYTFGRNPGSEHYHIQLKSPAVSRKQAKLIYLRDKYVLVNYADSSSNPTRVNDKEMAVNESVELQHDDIITMADVKLRFVSRS